MVQSLPLALTAASLLLLPPALADGLYSKSSAVLQVSGSTYDNLIAKSNHTSIVEFYAPWCGHCQSLKPAYEKAATSLRGLAKVAAVNCDEESNKPFCGSMGIQGFPTLKIVRPGKKPGKPIVEDYQGQRSAKGIVDAVIDKIPNHVKRLKDDDYEAWLEDGDGPKAILFSDKGSTSALLKAIAVDFLGVISVAQVRNSEKDAVAVFQVENFPTFVLLPGDGKDPVTYDGNLKKEDMVEFLRRAAEPNPNPAPKKAKSAKSDKRKASKASSSFADASKSQASSEAKTAKASQTLETMEEEPTESPDPNVVTEDTQTPIKLAEVAPPISTLSESVQLQRQCLNTKGGTCILALLPPATANNAEALSPEALQAVFSLSEIHHKHEAAKRNLFPFYQLPSSNPESATIRSGLSLSADAIELVAVNGKRAWYRHYPKSSFTIPEVEDWIDAIRMGDGAKSKLPDGLIVDVSELPAEDPVYVKLPEDYETNPEGLKEALKGQMPDGVEFEFEEINDDDYEKMIREAKEAAAKREKDGKGAENVVVEEQARKSDEPIEHNEL